MEKKSNYIEYNDANPLTERAALSLAIDVALPKDPQDWPTGLLSSWNNAAKAGAFESAYTIGDLARAWLQYRINLNSGQPTS